MLRFIRETIATIKMGGLGNEAEFAIVAQGRFLGTKVIALPHRWDGRYSKADAEATMYQLLKNGYKEVNVWRRAPRDYSVKKGPIPHPPGPAWY